MAIIAMKYQFNVKQLSAKLLTAKSSKAFRKKFSSSVTPKVLTIDDTALDLLSVQLELEASGLAYDLHHYASGKYRFKAKGPGGTWLGNFGEAVAVILLEAQRAKGEYTSVTRVVSWKPPKGISTKGKKFPMPDFIAVKNGQIGCIEVKCREALDFHDIATSAKSRLKISACAPVEECRTEALPQLAYTTSGAKVVQSHSLKLLGGTVSPFPGDFGMAVAVLVQDGRLKDIKKYASSSMYVPKDCQAAGRSCWDCLGTFSARSDLVVTWMRNSPGILSLLGNGERAEAWSGAYARWEQAIWTRELRAIRTSEQNILEASIDWSSRVAGEVPEMADALSHFWRSYVRSIASDRGVGDTDDATNEPVARLIAAPIATVLQEYPARYCWRSADHSVTASLSVYEEHWEIRACSSRWWDRARVSDELSASEVAGEVLSLLEFLAPRSIRPSERPVIPMTAIDVGLDEEPLLLGWRPRTYLEGGRTSGIDLGRSNAPVWLRWLLFGDARATMHVFLDGRVFLSSLFAHERTL